jgi:hypothetical protein
MTESELTAIRERLERLEKRNRRSAVLAIGMATVAVPLALFKTPDPISSVNQKVVANEFILWDKVGKTRAWLNLIGGGTTTPIWAIVLTATPCTANLAGSKGIFGFSTALTMAAVTAYNGSTTCSTGLSVSLGYK